MLPILLFFVLAKPDIPAVWAEFEKLASGPRAWPGFEPRKIPVAVFDGERTWLFQHPAPPEGFERRADAAISKGRAPGLVANNSMMLGGVRTATYVFAAGRDAREQAAVIIHEAFHVSQQAAHPGWGANEAGLFTYPVEDGELLALRRLEEAALARALAAEKSGCWAARAMAYRAARFARMKPEHVAYDRLGELNEGLAQYVEDVSLGRRTGRLPPGGFAADAVRQRAYATGEALALLLDKLAPEWKQRVNDGLDQLMPAADPAGCELEEAPVRAAAERDAAALAAKIDAAFKAALEQPGWTLVVAAPGQPLLPQGFDPMNVARGPGGRVLHRRFLKLGNGNGTIEVLDHPSVTRPAGEHPLFNGVRELIVPGLGAEPRVSEGNIEAPAVTGHFDRVRVSKDGRTVRIVLE